MPDRSGFNRHLLPRRGRALIGISAIDIRSQLRDLQAEDLFPVVEIEEGDWYDADQVEDTLLALTEAVGSRGYAFVDVSPQVETEPRGQDRRRDLRR